MVFDVSLVVETYLSYIPTHLQQRHYTKLSKVSKIELLFLRIESLGLCCFRRCRVVAGGTNEKAKRGAAENVRAAALTHGGGYSTETSVLANVGPAPSHSRLEVQVHVQVEEDSRLLHNSGGREVLLRLSLSFPGPTSTPDQPRARELCLDLLRLNQIHRSLESNVYSSCLVCGVTPVLVEVRESRCSMKGDAHAQHRLRDARVLAKSDD